MFYKAHPNIYQFTETLKDVQKDIYIKLRSTILIKTNIIKKEKLRWFDTRKEN